VTAVDPFCCAVSGELAAAAGEAGGGGMLPGGTLGVGACSQAGTCGLDDSCRNLCILSFWWGQELLLGLRAVGGTA
jgi:hypothetical protein